MSDLFTALASEAMGQPMPVTPRLRSRFEAPSPALSLTPDSETFVAVETAPAPAEQRPRRSAPRGDAPEEGVVDAFSHAAAPPPPSRETPAPAAHEVTTLPRTEIRDGFTQLQPQPAPPAPHPLAAIPSAEIPNAAQVEIRVQTQTRFHTETLLAASPVLPGSPPDAPREIPAARPPAVVTEILQSDISSAPSRGEPQAYRPPPARFEAQARPPSPSARRDAETPPAIQVTIGRIEVRAVTPPPARAAPAPKAAAPALSLAAYLEQRNRPSG